MDIKDIVTSRYTTKVFDGTKKIPEDKIAQLEVLLRFSPSSTNSQPWHFFLAGTHEGKARVAKGTEGFFSFNQAKVQNASHVVVLCTRTSFDNAYLTELLDVEQRAGRLPDAESRERQNKVRTHFVNLHRKELNDVGHWMEKQVYLALGTLLLGAAALGIDACPIEGFDAKALDLELGLGEKGLTSSVIVALGYRSPDDFNARLPKARLDAEKVITRL